MNPAALPGVLSQQGSSFAPTDIAGCELWLDASQITGLVDDDPVATWPDMSDPGSPFDFTQTNPAKRPTYKTNILNGRPVVRFDADLAHMNNISLNVAQPMTVFAVFQVKQTGPWSVFSVRAFLSGNSLAESWLYAGGGGGQELYYPSGITQSTWYTFAGRFNGASSKGNRSDSGATTAHAMGSLGWEGSNAQVIGGTDAFYSANIDAAEYIIYNTVLSGADVDLVGQYLQGKYGITWTGGAT